MSAEPAPEAGEMPPRPIEAVEIAVVTGGNDITRGYLNDSLLLPSQDSILRQKGGDRLTLYEELLTDDQVASTFQQRRAAVVSQEFVVEPGGTAKIDQMAADSLREQLDALDWDSTTNKMLYGVFYGYAVAEMMWDIEGTQVRIADIKVRKTRRFRYGADMRLRLLTSQQTLGQPLPDGKFWTFRAGADNDDEPYGLGLGHWLYWPVFFKRNGVKFWASALERFGAPMLAGDYPQGASEADKKAMQAAFARANRLNALITSAGANARILESGRGGGDFKAFADQWDDAIAKVVLSQTLTTGHGASLAQAKVHEGVKHEVIKSDDGLVSGSFCEGPATWLTAWNYPGAATPKVYRDLSEAEDLTAAVNIDKTLLSMGYRLKKEKALERYGDGYDQVPIPSMPASPDAPLPGFAAPAVADAPPATASLELVRTLDQATQPQRQAMVDQVASMLEHAGSLDDASDKLLGLYPQLDERSWAKLLGEALTVADLAGRASVT